MELCWYSLVAAVYKNTSIYLLTSVVLTVSSMLFVWLYEKSGIQQYFSNKMPVKQSRQAGEERTSDAAREVREEGAVVRPLDTRSLVEQISAEMTPEQRENEKAVEREQLAAIFELLREQEDKFHVSSMDQLEEQLNLYR